MDEWLNRADVSTFLTPKEYSQQLHNKAQKDFKVEYSKDQQLLQYNGLKDKYLKSYFQNDVMKNHLVKIGLILPDGSPKDKFFEYKPHWINSFDQEKEKLKKEGEKQIKNKRNYCRSSLGDNKYYTIKFNKVQLLIKQEENEQYKLPPLKYQLRSQTPKIDRPIINKKGVQHKLQLNTEDDQMIPFTQQIEEKNDNNKYFRAENNNLDGLNHIKLRQSHLKQYLDKTARVNQSFDVSTNARSSHKNMNLNDSYINSNNTNQRDKSPVFDSQVIEIKLIQKQQSYQNNQKQHNILNSNITPIKAQQIVFDQDKKQLKNQNGNNLTNYNFYGNNNISPVSNQDQNIIQNNRYSNKRISKTKTPQRNSQNQAIKDLIKQNDTKQIKGNIKQILSTKNRDNLKQINFDSTNLPQSTRQRNFQTDITQNRYVQRNSLNQVDYVEVVPAILNKPLPHQGNKQITTKLHSQHMQDMQNIQQKIKAQQNSQPIQSPQHQVTTDQSEQLSPPKQCVQFIIQQINTIEYNPNQQSKDSLINSTQQQQQQPIILISEANSDHHTKFQEYQQKSHISSQSGSPTKESNEIIFTNQNVVSHMNVMQMQHMQQQQIQQQSSKNIIQQSDTLQKMINQQQNKAQQRSIITQKLVLPQSISIDVKDEIHKQQLLQQQQQQINNPPTKK